MQKLNYWVVVVALLSQFVSCVERIEEYVIDGSFGIPGNVNFHMPECRASEFWIGLPSVTNPAILERAAILYEGKVIPLSFYKSPSPSRLFKNYPYVWYRAKLENTVSKLISGNEISMEMNSPHRKFRNSNGVVILRTLE